MILVKSRVDKNMVLKKGGSIIINRGFGVNSKLFFGYFAAWVPTGILSFSCWCH